MRTKTPFFHKILFNNYEVYKAAELRSDRIVFNDIKKLLTKLRRKNRCTIEKLGKSIEGRDINIIKMGRGRTKILAWTQMHGDEPTATGAAADVINFLIADDDYNKIREQILSNVSIYFILMLNPDGAEKHIRENSIGIDINRDALRLTSPESKILWNAAKKIKPEFGFNLHDQNSYYTAGRSGKSASISLLSPPLDYEKSINPARQKSMKVVGYLFDILSEYIPGHIAKYSDEFEPRAFGDNFTKAGISTILIESGFMKGDNDKSLIRKLNFISLLSAFNFIGEKKYRNLNTKKYNSIPENESLLFDLMLKNLSLKVSGKKFIVDIGINRERKYDRSKKKFYYKSSIAQIGDLSTHNGIEEINFNGLLVKPALVHNKPIDMNKLSTINFNKQYKRGIGYFRMNKYYNGVYSEYPVNLINSPKTFSPQISIDEPANLIITNIRNQIIYLIINGFVYDFRSDKNFVPNGTVIM